MCTRLLVLYDRKTYLTIKENGRVSERDQKFVFCFLCLQLLKTGQQRQQLPQNQLHRRRTDENDEKVETISDYLNHIRRNSAYHLDIAIRVNSIDYQR